MFHRHSINSVSSLISTTITNVEATFFSSFVSTDTHAIQFPFMDLTFADHVSLLSAMLTILQVNICRGLADHFKAEHRTKSCYLLCAIKFIIKETIQKLPTL